MSVLISLSESEFVRDYVTKNFRRAGVNLTAQSIPQADLYSLIRGVAVASAYLDGIDRTTDCGFRCIDLGNRRLQRGWLAFRFQPGSMKEKQACGFEPDFHIRNAVRNSLESADRLARQLPLTCVGDCLGNLPLHGADLPSQNEGTLPFHGIIEDSRTLAFPTQSAGYRNSTLVEIDFRHRRTTQSHFVDWCAYLNPPRPFDQECSQSKNPGAVLETRKDYEKLRIWGAGNEGFRAGKHVEIAITAGPST